MSHREQKEFEREVRDDVTRKVAKVTRTPESEQIKFRTHMPCVCTLYSGE